MSPARVRPAADRQRRAAGRAIGRAMGDDAGTTLAELAVVMTLTTAFIAIFTTSIVQMYRISNTNQSQEVAQTQVHLAFVRVERELRYAAGITEPGQVGTNTYQVGADYYAEYVTTNTGPAICGQFRLDAAAKQLKWRSWPREGTPPATWTVFASDISAPLKPFTFYEADITYGPVQQLRLQLSATVGSGPSAVTRKIEERFTARNTSVRTQDIKPAEACKVRS